MGGLEAQALCLGDEIYIDTISNVSFENICLCYALEVDSRTLAMASRMIHVPMMDTAVRLNT